MIKLSDNIYLIGNKEPESNLPENSDWVEFTTWDDASKGIRRYVRGAPSIKELTSENYADNHNPQ